MNTKKKPEEILFLHFATWMAETHPGMGSPTVQEMQEETSIEQVCIPAMLEYGQAVAEQAVSIYSEYIHSAQVILEDGKPYMEVRLRWALPGQESPESRVMNINHDNRDA